MFMFYQSYTESFYTQTHSTSVDFYYVDILCKISCMISDIQCVYINSSVCYAGRLYFKTLIYSNMNLKIVNFLQSFCYNCLFWNPFRLPTTYLFILSLFLSIYLFIYLFISISYVDFRVVYYHQNETLNNKSNNLNCHYLCLVYCIVL